MLKCHQYLTKNLEMGLAKTFRVYLISIIMSLDQSMNSLSLLLGEDLSTSYLNSSLTSSLSSAYNANRKRIIVGVLIAQKGLVLHSFAYILLIIRTLNDVPFTRGDALAQNKKLRDI